MNKINAQINELHEWANQLRERENEFGIIVRALVAALRDAAYTIQQLYDDLQRANAENAKLQEFCSELLQIAESNDPDFLHWPEIHDELQKLGVKIVKI